jgi:hypothetical protein
MSASVILMFEKGEIKKVKKWFDKVCPTERYPDLPIPDGGFRKDIERGLYVTFSNNVVELDYAIWDDMAGCFATHIGQELNKYFKVKKAGWDSVGYCTKDFIKASGLLAWRYKEMVERSKKEGSISEENIKAMENEAKIREQAEEFYRKEARKIVNETICKE